MTTSRNTGRHGLPRKGRRTLGNGLSPAAHRVGRIITPPRSADGPEPLAGPGAGRPHPLPDPGTPAVRLRSVSRIHGTGGHAVTALHDISLTFPRGSFTAVMGPSGSGKSTLLQCAAGLDRPTSGSVTVGGTELTGLGERRLTLLRRDRIGFVFQSFNLLPALTAEQNVALPLRLAGRRPAKGEVRAALERVGLGDRARHRPAELSGGQQQRVALARALVTRPDVLFGDEPTGALDTRTGRRVLDLLRETADRDGRAVVMVTHDPVAAARADRVVFLVDGRITGELTSPDAESVAARMARLETAEAADDNHRSPGNPGGQRDRRDNRGHEGRDCRPNHRSTADTPRRTGTGNPRPTDTGTPRQTRTGNPRHEGTTPC